MLNLAMLGASIYASYLFLGTADPIFAVNLQYVIAVSREGGGWSGEWWLGGP